MSQVHFSFPPLNKGAIALSTLEKRSNQLIRCNILLNR